MITFKAIASTTKSFQINRFGFCVCILISERTEQCADENFVFVYICVCMYTYTYIYIYIYKSTKVQNVVILIRHLYLVSK